MTWDMGSQASRRCWSCTPRSGQVIQFDRGQKHLNLPPHSTRRIYDSVITPHQFGLALDWPESCV